MHYDQTHPSHQPLFRRLATLEALIARPEPASAKEMRDALAVLRADVQAHFRDEEHSGLLSSLTRGDPRFQHAVDCLVDEHRSLEDGLDVLLGLAATPDVADEPFRRKLRSWITRARKHEIDEDVVLMEGVNQDVGAAD
jgi:hypothetical protein